MKEYDLSKRENLRLYFKDFLNKNKNEDDFKKLEDAVYFAKEKHKNQLRKGTNILYINHPLEVSIFASHITCDIDTIVSAVLHDTLEDTDTTYDEIKNVFGKKVADIVLSDSEDKMRNIPKDKSWHLRKKSTISKAKHANREEKIILLCDKLSNLMQTKEDYDKIGDKAFLKFNQKDKKMHEWYHRELLKCFDELKKYDEYKKYKELINYIFI